MENEVGDGQATSMDEKEIVVMVAVRLAEGGDVMVRGL